MTSFKRSSDSSDSEVKSTSTPLTVGLAIGVPVVVFGAILLALLYKNYRINKREEQDFQNDPNFATTETDLPDYPDINLKYLQTSNTSNDNLLQPPKPGIHSDAHSIRSNSSSISQTIQKYPSFDNIALPFEGETNSIQNLKTYGRILGTEYNAYSSFKTNNGSSGSLTDVSSQNTGDWKHKKVNDIESNFDSSTLASPLSQTFPQNQNPYQSQLSQQQQHHEMQQQSKTQPTQQIAQLPNPYAVKERTLTDKSPTGRSFSNLRNEVVVDTSTDSASVSEKTKNINPAPTHLESTNELTVQQSVYDGFEDDDTLSEKEKEKLRKMKSVYQVYFDRSNTIKEKHKTDVTYNSSNYNTPATQNMHEPYSGADGTPVMLDGYYAPQADLPVISESNESQYAIHDEKDSYMDSSNPYMAYAGDAYAAEPQNLLQSTNNYVEQNPQPIAEAQDPVQQQQYMYHDQNNNVANMDYSTQGYVPKEQQPTQQPQDYQQSQQSQQGQQGQQGSHNPYSQYDDHYNNQHTQNQGYQYNQYQAPPQQYAPHGVMPQQVMPQQMMPQQMMPQQMMPQQQPAPEPLEPLRKLPNASDLGDVNNSNFLEFQAKRFNPKSRKAAKPYNPLEHSEAWSPPLGNSGPKFSSPLAQGSAPGPAHTAPPSAAAVSRSSIVMLNTVDFGISKRYKPKLAKGPAAYK